MGTFAGLNAGIADPDCFSFMLAPKEVLAVSGLAPGETATLLSWDPDVACGGDDSVQSCGPIFGPATGGASLANTTATPRRSSFAADGLA